VVHTDQDELLLHADKLSDAGEETGSVKSILLFGCKWSAWLLWLQGGDLGRIT
jgi:hypothetical protein